MALSAAAAACVGAPVPKVGEPAPALKDAAAEAAYQATLDRYTSRREIYNRLDTRLFGAMTLQSAAFVEARVRRQAAFQDIPSATADADVAKAQAEVAGEYVFFLGVHLNDHRYDDLDKRDSTWRLALVAPSGDVTPLKVERVGRSNLNLRALYPYLDDFWTAYRVRFPRALPPGTARLEVHLASALGQASFEFPAE